LLGSVKCRENYYYLIGMQKLCKLNIAQTVKFTENSLSERSKNVESNMLPAKHFLRLLKMRILNLYVYEGNDSSVKENCIY
jgi:hypothetical protein